MDLEFCKHIRVESHDLLYGLIERTELDPQEAPWPTVRVAVGSHIYSGTPIKIEKVREEYWLVLFTSSPPGLDTLSIVPIRSISGITLMNPEEFKAAICEPGPWTMDGKAVPPSRFEIERMLSSTVELLRPLPSAPQIQLRWDTFEAQPTSRILAAEALKSLQKLLPKILGDQIGREALQGIETWELRFQPDAAIEVKRQGALFQIDFGFKANVKQFEKSLSSAVEKNL